MIPIPEPKTTLLKITCYDVHGNPTENGIVKITLVSGNELHGTFDGISTTANANKDGIVFVEITKGSGFRYKLDRIDNVSTKGSYFNGVDEDFLELNANLD